MLNYKGELMKIRFLVSIILSLLVFVGCDKKNKISQSPSSLKKIVLVDGNYILNTQKSKFNWVGKELSTKTHTGTLDLKNGEIQINADGQIDGFINIDMTTINVTDLEGQWKSKLEGHLKSADFFGVDNHPKASIRFKGNSKSILNNQIELSGELAIKTKIEFDRSKYNVRFRSGSFFDNLGDKLILDDINVDVIVFARLKN
jgi:polyisoprenoid-binding protein YceI